MADLYIEEGSAHPGSSLIGSYSIEDLDNHAWSIQGKYSRTRRTHGNRQPESIALVSFEHTLDKIVGISSAFQDVDTYLVDEVDQTGLEDTAHVIDWYE